MHIVICDDELIQQQLLKHFVEEYFQIQKLPLKISCFDSAQKLWWSISDGLICDFFLLDIQMEKMSGIELAFEIRKNDKYTPLAFISGIKDYVFEGYEVNALSYVLKPYEKSQIFRLLDKVLISYNEKKCFSLWIIKGESVKLYHDDIVSCESLGHDTIIYLRDESEVVVKMSLNGVLEQLNNPYFLKIHRCSIINLKNTQLVSKASVQMIDAREINIARGNYEMVMQAFIKHHRY